MASYEFYEYSWLSINSYYVKKLFTAGYIGVDDSKLLLIYYMLYIIGPRFLGRWKIDLLLSYSF